MGFSYRTNPATGRKALACDGCPHGIARKRSCPAGWCPSSAYCAACWAGGKRAELAAWHTKCHAAAAAYAAECAARDARLAAGEFLRCSALGGDDNVVHVLFRNAAGTTAGAYMSAGTYAAIPLTKDASLADFNAVGFTWNAPEHF